MSDMRIILVEMGSWLHNFNERRHGRMPPRRTRFDRWLDAKQASGPGRWLIPIVFVAIAIGCYWLRASWDGMDSGAALVFAIFVAALTIAVGVLVTVMRSLWEGRST